MNNVLNKFKSIYKSIINSINFIEFTTKINNIISTIKIQISVKFSDFKPVILNVYNYLINIKNICFSTNNMIKIKQFISNLNNTLSDIKSNIITRFNILKPVIYNISLKILSYLNKFKITIIAILKSENICFNKSLIDIIILFVFITRALNREMIFMFLLFNELKLQKHIQQMFLKYCA